MIKLEGTEKQVKLANDIRSELIKCINQVKDLGEEGLRENHISRGKDESTFGRKADEFNRIVSEMELILDNTSAKYYIENFKELTDKSKSESSKLYVLADKVTGKAIKTILFREVSKKVKQYVPNEDRVIKIGIKLKDMQHGKYYRFEDTIITNGDFANTLYRIHKGTVISKIYDKDAHGNASSILKGYIESTNSNSTDFKYNTNIDQIYIRGNYCELIVSEIEYSK